MGSVEGIGRNGYRYSMNFFIGISSLKSVIPL